MSSKRDIRSHVAACRCVRNLLVAVMNLMTPAATPARLTGGRTTTAHKTKQKPRRGRPSCPSALFALPSTYLARGASAVLKLANCNPETYTKGLRSPVSVCRPAHPRICLPAVLHSSPQTNQLQPRHTKGLRSPVSVCRPAHPSTQSTTTAATPSPAVAVGRAGGNACGGHMTA